MSILNLILEHWGIISVVIGSIFYYFTHKKVATEYAKKLIAQLMLSAEKGSEELVLATGKDKFDWVIEKGYALLPAPIKVFISYDLFKNIAQSLFDDALKFIAEHSKKDDQ